MLLSLRKQATVSNVIKLAGIGVHSGAEVKLEIHPASENQGVVFERTDITDKDNIIKLTAENVVEPVMCTRVTNKSGVSVSVIEHLMAALRISGITNALIKIDGEEIPIMDGSAKCFLEAIRTVGVTKQNSEVPAIIVNSPVSLVNENSSISVTPSLKPSFKITLDYERINGVIKNNRSVKFDLVNKNKIREIAAARTLGWLADCEKIRKMGLAKGASLDNTVIIDENNKIANPGGLRHKKEIVNHKALDLIGDFALIGIDIIGDIKGVNTSHLQNNLFLRKLMKEKHLHTLVNTSEELEYILKDNSNLLISSLSVAS